MQLTMVLPIELPVLGNLACRLLDKVLVWVAGVNELSVPVPVPRRSAPAVVPKAEVEHKVLPLWTGKKKKKVKRSAKHLRRCVIGVHYS